MDYIVTDKTGVGRPYLNWTAFPYATCPM